MNGKTTVAKKVKVKAKETEINAKVVTGYLEKALGKNRIKQKNGFGIYYL
mgnify:CR=1 FL=1